MYKIIERQIKARAKWIDDEVSKLMPRWFIPILIRFPFLNIFTGIKIINRQLIAGFGNEVIIKQFGKIKAVRKFR